MQRPTTGCLTCLMINNAYNKYSMSVCIVVIYMRSCVVPMKSQQFDVGIMFHEHRSYTHLSSIRQAPVQDLTLETMFVVSFLSEFRVL